MENLVKDIKNIEDMLEKISERIVIVSYDSFKVIIKGVNSFIELKNVILEGPNGVHITIDEMKIFY